MSGLPISTNEWKTSTNKILDLIEKLDMMTQFPNRQIKGTLPADDDLQEIQKLFKDEAHDEISLFISKNTELLLKLFAKRSDVNDSKGQFYFVRVSHSLVSEISMYAKSLRDIKDNNVLAAQRTDLDKEFNEFIKEIVQSMVEENQILKDEIQKKKQGQSWREWFLSAPLKAMNLIYDGTKNPQTPGKEYERKDKISRMKHLKVVTMAVLTANILKEYKPLLLKLQLP